MSSKPLTMPIAIVGLAAQLPSGPNSFKNLDYKTFWNFLSQNQQAFENIPQERLEGLSQITIPNPVGCFLKDAQLFDNVEFGVSTKDTIGMTASTRRQIELSFLALLDSGIDYRGRKVGSFAAGTNAEALAPDHMDYRNLGTRTNTLANRVAYSFDLAGPSLYIDTACSSTLIATHLAISAIEKGDCEAAVVSGCQYDMDIWDWFVYSDNEILSSDRSKPFDSAADGFVRGEGAVAIVIKSLDAALMDNDHIYAVILGTATNNNGSDATLYKPSGKLIQQCIRDAFLVAGRDPRDVDYVELHATGTSVGDPIETNAAGEVFHRGDGIIVGSVKGNLGHLEAVAFFASLLKVCLIFEKKEIPPNANLHTPNPNIAWDKYNLKVPAKILPLGTRSKTGRSLISLASSGIGGSNGHAVLEQPPQLSNTEIRIRPDEPIVFIVGGLSPKAATKIATELADILKTDPSLEALSQTTVHARRARQMPFRTHFLYAPGTEIVVPNPVLVPKVQPSLAFVFTGQGPQHTRMGQSLFLKSEVFRNTILELDQVYERVTGHSLIKTTGLFDQSFPLSLPTVWSVEQTLPALCMTQIALFDLLVSVGAKPNVLVGHSAGETVMLYASGAGPRAMALELTIARSKAMKMTELLGAGMAVLGCGFDDAVKIVDRATDELDGILEIGCHNSPETIVISGSAHLVQRAADLAKEKGIFARKVQTLAPSHSSLMNHCREVYFDNVRKVFERYPGAHKPVIPCYSTIAGNGKFIDEFTPDYIWNNVRLPVHFHQAISLMLRDNPGTVFVEISPHPALSTYISKVSDSQSTAICPMRRPSKGNPASVEISAFCSSLGALVTQGINSIDLTTLYGRASRDPAYDIPYPFTLRTFPLRIDGPREAPHVKGNCSLSLKMNASTFPDLSEHVVNGEPIVPATGFIDIVLQAGARILWDVEFKRMLSLASEIPLDVRLEYQGHNWAIKTPQLTAAAQSYDDQVHAFGSSSNNMMTPPQSIDVRRILASFPLIDTYGFYDLIERFVAFGPRFQRVKKLRGTPQEGMAVISIPHTSDRTSYVFNPVILDACCHYVLHPTIAQSIDDRSIFLVSKCRKLTFYAAPKPGSVVYSHYTLREWTPDTRNYDFTLYDETGSALVAMTGFELRRNSTSSPPDVKCRYEVTFQPIVTPTVLPRFVTQWSRPDKEEYELMMSICDHEAQLVLRQSLGHGVTVGDDLDRQRYYRFASDAADRQLPLLPPSFVIEDLKEKWPTNFQIVERLRRSHHEIFKTSAATVQALYSDNIMTKFYSRRATFGPVCELAAKLFDQTISTFANSGKKVLRVLEIGAGTGLLTRSLCECLENRDDVIVEYVVSDISLALANDTAKSLPYLRAFPKAYDLCSPPEDQGISLSSFDLIVGLGVIHVVPDIKNVLESLYRTLVPGGSLLTVELDGSDWERRPGSLWTDMVFGGFSEWFSYADGRSHPSVVPEEWAHLTQSVGFVDFQCSTEIGGGREFLFAAQKPHTEQQSFDITNSGHHFLAYTFGKEIELQVKIKGFDVDEDISLWILASEGNDGEAARGLVKGLSREYINWEIHLGIFDKEFDEVARVQRILAYGDCLSREAIVHFGKDGIALVSKVIPSAPPLPLSPSDASLNLVQNHLPSLVDQQLLIDVHCWSNSVSPFRGFSGTIIQSKYVAFKQGWQVVGLAHNQEMSDKLVCSAGSVMILGDDDDAKTFTECALASAITTLILGPARTADDLLEKPPLKVLLADEDVVSSMIQRFCSAIATVVETKTIPIDDDEKFDIIVTSSEELAKRPEVRLWRGRILVWDDMFQELISGDSWILGHLIKTSLRATKVNRSISEPSAVTHSRPSVPASLEQKTPQLFNPSKAYLLIGGVSDLGVHFALWMYQYGVKNIVLTSRRGCKFLDADALEVTRLKVKYLQRCTDLSIRLEAGDATSVVAMQRLIDSINEPLGGCFLMPLVLSDGLFANQTQDSFNRVVSSKWDSIKVLEAIVPIQTLDFCVSFSSIGALFGLSGQSNYIMANTVVDGHLARHRNAFSVCVPSISDLGSFARYPEAHRGILELAKISPDALCAYFEDALLKLYSGVRAPYYIPEMPWNGVHKVAGLTSDTYHLASRKEIAANTSANDESSALDKVLDLLDLSMSDFSPEVPFTSYGMDSLAATRVSEALRPFVKVSQMQLLGGMTWNHLEAKLRENGSVADSPTTNPVEPLLKMVEKYSKNFENHIPSLENPATEDVIVITGTTGSLGSSALNKCLQAPNVKHIYALNRHTPDLVKTQKEAFASRGFDPSLVDATKLTLLNADLATDDLGIGELQLDKIRTTATHIIHIGWLVKWSLGLSQFEPLIRGTRNLIDLALSSPLPTPPRVVFISTVTVLRGLAESGELCPEIFVEPDMALGSGYTESKWVAERLFELVSSQTSLRPVIVRVDQVCGSKNGQWNTAEWIPTLVQSATVTRSLPDSPSLANWLPAEVVGSAIVEIRNSSSRVVHITHPNPVPWRFIFQRVAQTLDVSIVPFRHWLSQLEGLATSPVGKDIKAIALLSTFRTIDLSSGGFLPRMSNTNALRESPTLASSHSLTVNDVDSWLSYWKGISFITF